MSKADDYWVCIDFLYPIAYIIIGAIELYPVYPPHWDFDKFYPSWYQLLFRVVESVFTYPIHLIVLGPPILAGFLVIRFKSWWIDILTILASLWAIFILLLSYGFSQMHQGFGY